jgi:hypothetical protein
MNNNKIINNNNNNNNKNNNNNNNNMNNSQMEAVKARAALGDILTRWPGRQSFQKAEALRAAVTARGGRATGSTAENARTHPVGVGVRMRGYPPPPRRRWKKLGNQN